MQKIAKEGYKVFIGFSFFGILFIPFPFYGFPFQKDITSFLFEDFIIFLIQFLFDSKVLNPDFSSDSLMMYFLVLILLILAIFVYFILRFRLIFINNQQNILNFLQLISIYYLALLMLKYGFDKVLKIQFYLPEPNLLYTPLGQIDKDMLYWSTIGSSHSYNVFLGLCEIIPALLLLHKKTRTLGALVLFGVLFHVVMINMSYDISVKLFSSFLLLISFLILTPSLNVIFQFLVMNKRVQLQQISGSRFIQSKAKYRLIKTIILCFLAFETLMPLIKIGALDGDQLPKYALHGAYEAVSSPKMNNDLKNIKRVFFHKDNYLIFQFYDDSFLDYHVVIKPNQLILTDYDHQTLECPYQYTKSHGELILYTNKKALVFNALPWNDLPLLQPLFHWTVDDL